MHERSKSEHLKKIADQKDEIHHLKCELAEAVVENGNLEELLAVKSDRGLRRKVYALISIFPILNGKLIDVHL